MMTPDYDTPNPLEELVARPRPILDTGVTVERCTVVKCDGYEVVRWDDTTSTMTIGVGRLSRRGTLAVLSAMLMHAVCTGITEESVPIADLLHDLDQSLQSGRTPTASPF